MMKHFVKLLFAVSLVFNSGSLWGMLAAAAAINEVDLEHNYLAIGGVRDDLFDQLGEDLRQFFYSIASGETEKVGSRIKTIIDKMPNIDTSWRLFAHYQTREGYNALLLATHYGHTEIINIIVEKLRKSWKKDMKLLALINHSTFCTAFNENIDYTPLQLGAKNGHTDAVKTLINFIIELNKDDTQKTLKALNYLTTHGEGYSPVLLAAHNGHTEVIKCIVGLMQDASFDSEDIVSVLNCVTRNSGFTSLHLAARAGHSDLFKDLMVIIQDVNEVNDLDTNELTIGDYSRLLHPEALDRSTPLHLAAQYGKPEIVRLLLEDAYWLEYNGMEILHCTTKTDKTPLALAVENNHTEIVELITAFRPDGMLSAQKDEAFKVLILNIGSKGAYTPLRLARRHKRKEIVIILLTKMLIDVQVPVFWSPDDRLEDILIALIDNENKRIRIAVFYLSSCKIAQAMINAHKRGVTIKCVTEKRNTGVHSKIQMLLNEGIRIWINRYSALMHNKYAIFDKNFNGHSFVSTGSYNFTEHAKKNRENMIVLHDNTAIQKFSENHKKLRAESEQLE